MNAHYKSSIIMYVILNVHLLILRYIRFVNGILAINIWKEEPSTMDVMVEGTWAPQVAHMLRDKQVPYRIAMPDVNSLYEQEMVTNSCFGLARHATNAYPMRTGWCTNLVSVDKFILHH